MKQTNKVLDFVIGVARGAWDPNISPQEAKRRHDGAKRARQQRQAKRDAEVARVIAENRRLSRTNRYSSSTAEYQRRAQRAKLARQNEEARANRTPEQQRIVDDVKRLNEAMAKPASRPTSADQGDWPRAFRRASGRYFARARR